MSEMGWILAVFLIFAANFPAYSAAPICAKVFHADSSGSRAFNKFTANTPIENQFFEFAGQYPSEILWLEKNSIPFHDTLAEISRTLEAKDRNPVSFFQIAKNKNLAKSKAEAFLWDFLNRINYLMYQVSFVKTLGAEKELLSRLIMDRLSYSYFWNYNKHTFENTESKKQWAHLKYPLYKDQFYFSAMARTASSGKYSRTRASKKSLPSDQINALGWNYAIHATPIENLAPILKSRKLKINEAAVPDDSASYGTKRFDQVFFEPISYAKSGQEIEHFRMSRNAEVKKKITSVALVFDLGLFDEKDGHFSTAWLYGETRPGYSARLNDTDRLLELLADSASGRRGDEYMSSAGLHTELVINHEVGLNLLREIWVHPSLRAQVLENLRSQGITQWRGRPIEELVLAKEVFD